MLAQINDLPQLELVHWVWIGIGFLFLFVIVCTIINCKKTTITKEENDPMNEEILKIGNRNIKIKSPNNKVNCTEHGVEIIYTFREAFEFSKSHPYYYFQYWDYENNDYWFSRSDFFGNYDYQNRLSDY